MAELVRAELSTAADAAALAERLSAAAARAVPPTYVRVGALKAAAALLEGEAETFAKLVSSEAGKALKEARAEAARSLFLLRRAAEESPRLVGEIRPRDLERGQEGRFVLARAVPRGPAVLRAPLSSPLEAAVEGFAPAVAAGAAFALIPDPRASGAAARLLQALVDAGWPADAAVLAGGERGALDLLAADPRVKIRSAAGGKPGAGVFVDAGADLPWAAARCAWSAYADRSASAVRRIYADTSVHAEFRRLLVRNIQELKSGEPSNPETDVAPLPDEASAAALENVLKDAVARGARLWAGGPRKGALLPPALVEGVPEDSPLALGAAAGPAAALDAEGSRERALDRLSALGRAAVFTNDLGFAERVRERLPGAVLNDVPDGVRMTTSDFIEFREGEPT